MSNQEGDIFQIEKILKHRVDKKRGKLYYIKWQGWNSSHNTWEPEENILDKDLLELYNNSKNTPRTSAKRTPSSSQRRSGGTRAKRAKYDSDQDSSAANNSVLSSSPVQSEGHFDIEDADKEPEEQVKEKSKSRSPEVSVPEAQPEMKSNLEETETKNEEVEVREEEKEEEPQQQEEEPVVEQPVETQSEEPVEEQKEEQSNEEKEKDEKEEVKDEKEEVKEEKEEAKEEKKEEEKKDDAGPLEFFGYPTNGEESLEYQVTEQNNPQCEVKIQAVSQLCVTLQTEKTANDPPSEPAADPQEVVPEGEKVLESNTASEHFDQ